MRMSESLVSGDSTCSDIAFTIRFLLTATLNAFSQELQIIETPVPMPLGNKPESRKNNLLPLTIRKKIKVSEWFIFIHSGTFSWPFTPDFHGTLAPASS